MYTREIICFVSRRWIFLGVSGLHYPELADFIDLLSEDLPDKFSYLLRIHNT